VLTTTQMWSKGKGSIRWGWVQGQDSVGTKGAGRGAGVTYIRGGHVRNVGCWFKISRSFAAAGGGWGGQFGTRKRGYNIEDYSELKFAGKSLCKLNRRQEP